MVQVTVQNYAARRSLVEIEKAPFGAENDVQTELSPVWERTQEAIKRCAPTVKRRQASRPRRARDTSPVAKNGNAPDRNRPNLSRMVVVDFSEVGKLCARVHSFQKKCTRGGVVRDKPDCASPCP
jgi:hypothetical protein